MTTYKDRAEKYVRGQLPELMELSFGCEYRNSGHVYKSTRTNFSLIKNQNGDRFYRCEGIDGGVYMMFVHDDFEIIGHPIQLHHWVDAMRPHFNFDRFYLRLDGKLMFKDNGVDFKKFRFNLTTGQPCTKADYKAFCIALGV